MCLVNEWRWVVEFVIRSFVGSPGTVEIVENTIHHILSLEDKEMICRFYHLKTRR